MKSILISIQSPHACNILNLIKWWEIRKKFPKDYVGWVYIYCTKGGALLFKEESTNTYWAEEENKNYRPHYALNGKVVARFWCDKVEEIKQIETIYGFKRPLGEYLKGSCLSFEEMFNYLNGNKGYAIHITNLEIFDKPKEISEFCVQKGFIEFTDIFTNKTTVEPNLKPLTRAPQSYCYVEEK